MSYYYSDKYETVEIQDMLGKTMVSVEQQKNDNDELHFTCDDGTVYVFTHMQDCCESVRIEDITGDLSDLVGNQLVQADEETNSDVDKPDKWSDSWTWTFYKFATTKGYVTVRWLGESNGYYCERVDLFKSKS